MKLLANFLLCYFCHQRIFCSSCLSNSPPIPFLVRFSSWSSPCNRPKTKQNTIIRFGYIFGYIFEPLQYGTFLLLASHFRVHKQMINILRMIAIYKGNIALIGLSYHYNHYITWKNVIYRNEKFKAHYKIAKSDR